MVTIARNTQTLSDKAENQDGDAKVNAKMKWQVMNENGQYIQRLGPFSSGKEILKLHENGKINDVSLAWNGVTIKQWTALKNLDTFKLSKNTSNVRSTNQRKKWMILQDLMFPMHHMYQMTGRYQVHLVGKLTYGNGGV